MSQPRICRKCGAELPAGHQGFCANCLAVTATSDSSSGAAKTVASEWVIKVELAGMKRENLELILDGDRLKIAGTRADEDSRVTAACPIGEVAFGRFERVVAVPPEFDLKAATAAYQNGFLRVTVPSRR